MKFGLSILLFLVLKSVTLAQVETSNHKIDSLKKIIASDVNDSLEVKALRAWDELIYLYDMDLDWKLNEKIDSICKLNLKKKLSKKALKFFTLSKAEAQNAFGYSKQQVGENQEALFYYTQYLKLCQKINDQNGIAAAYSNLGLIQHILGRYDLATEYHLKSLRIRELKKNKKGMAISYGNIAMVYKYKGQLSMALKYNLKSLALVEKMDDDYSLSLLLNNVGTTIQDLGDSLLEVGDEKSAKEKYRESLKYYERSLELTRKIQDVYGEGIALHNLGNIYTDLEEMNISKDYYKQSIAIREKIDDRVGLSSTLNNLAIIYNNEGKFREALTLCTKAFNLAKQASSMEEVSYSAKIIHDSYKYLGRYKEALEFYEHHIRLRDSLEDDANKKSILRMEFKYGYEKQATKDSVKNAEQQKVKDAVIEAQRAKSSAQESELKNKRYQQYLMIGGISLLIMFLAFVYNRFRVTRKQKEIIEEQKKVVENQKSIVEEAHHQLEEKNKEILDSINYAKRIQAAILPPRKLVKEYLPDSFILYKPKDIVAGDFYWLEHKNNTLLFAACDCTGHGVPGAMVSVVCNNGLNRAVREYGLMDPGKILDKTREIVIQEFEKSEDEVKDGMDVSLVNLEISKNEIVKLKWAGANNPMWLIRQKSGSEFDLIEFKANKQPIGKYAEPKPFTTHEIDIQKGDVFYIFTDGFQDQFGGEKGKKFKAAKFKELLLAIQSKSMEEQRVIIENEFEKWRGDLEQNDDVCIIGIKI